MLYPQQDNSIAYEITDHLGNVRALLREDVVTIVATMEDNGVENPAAPFDNPRVEEMQYFENLTETEYSNITGYLNNTPASPRMNYPKYASFLTGLEGRIIGPATVMKVRANEVSGMTNCIQPILRSFR